MRPVEFEDVRFLYFFIFYFCLSSLAVRLQYTVGSCPTVRGIINSLKYFWKNSQSNQTTDYTTLIIRINEANYVN